MSLVAVPATLRTRLALWHTVVLLLVLLLHDAIVYASVRRVLWRELDERLHHDVETFEGLLQSSWTPDGPRTPHGESPLDDDDFRWLQVWSREGRLLFASDVAAAKPVPNLATPSRTATSLQVKGLGEMRLREEPGHIAGQPVVIRTMTSEATLRQELRDVIWSIGLAVPFVVGIAAAGSHRLARRMLRPVDRLVASARAITADHLDARLPVDDPRNEVGQLAFAFNTTLTRLEAAFEQMRRFTANAAHELRTPVTALRAAGQAALLNDRGLQQCQDAIADMLEDAEQLSRLLDTMIMLAQADAGTLPLTYTTIEVSALVTAVVRECEVLASEKDQHVVLACAGGVAIVDPTILRIAVANLVHNAIRYGPTDSTVAVRAFPQNGWWTIEVEDAGPGIPPAHQAHLFERFYRVDHGRSRSLGGAGLGLAMARWAVEAHAGHIEVDSQEGRGSTFRLTFPKSDASPP